MVDDARSAAMEYFRRAYDHQVKGRLEEAVELYRKSIEVYPTAEALHLLRVDSFAQ